MSSGDWTKGNPAGPGGSLTSKPTWVDHLEVCGQAGFSFPRHGAVRGHTPRPILAITRSGAGGLTIAERHECDHTGELFRHQGSVMKWYQIAGDWKQFKGMVKQKWSKLTDGDLATFGGNPEQLAALLQQKYGYAKDEAEREISEFSHEHKK